MFRSRGSQQIRNHGPLLNQPESGIQFEWLNVAPHRTGVPQSANSAASQHNPTGNEFNVLNSYSGGTQTQHSEETTTNLQQHDQSNSTTANTPYQYHNDLTDYSNFATMLPSSHPEISLQPATIMTPSSRPQISLQRAKAMTPSEHPRNFQPTSSSSPMNPQIPLPPDVSFSILQPRQGLLTEEAIDCL